MEDLIYSVLTHGDHVLFWVLAVVGAFVARLVLGQIKAGKIQQVVGRALREVGDAVMMVGKTYVEALKAASADGTLTDAEKAEAKARAIAAAKKNIGVDGLKALGRILGLGDGDDSLTHWLETKVESAVASVGPKVVSTTLVAGEVSKTTTEVSADPH
jgi:Sec-independent protein translocase protein TatA